MSTNGIPSSWKRIRDTLVNNFSDHRDETALYTDLSMMTQGHNTPHVFYEKGQTLLTTIMTYVELHEEVQTTIEAKRQLYKNLALQTFLRGLNEPYGSRIRCMRPPTLEKALEYVQEEMNIVYLQQKNHVVHKSIRPEAGPKPFDFSVQKNLNMPSTSWQPKPFQFQQFRQPFQGPSRTQQIFRALPRSNMSTGFRIPPRNNFPSNQNRPTPMSGVSHPIVRQIPRHPPTETREFMEIHLLRTISKQKK